jgi:hypothetical protein
MPLKWIHDLSRKEAERLAVEMGVQCRALWTIYINV